jgi:hypothetical protein
VEFRKIREVGRLDSAPASGSIILASSAIGITLWLISADIKRRIERHVREEAPDELLGREVQRLKLVSGRF